MKTPVIIFSLISSICVQAQIKIPNAVTAAFTKQFPNAMNVKWGKENAKEYKANFKLNGKKKEIELFEDGKFVR